MAKSSINFQQMKVGATAHNDRSLEDPSYLLPIKFREKNDVDISSEEADKKANKLLSEAKINYKKHFNQRLQAKTYLWEAVVNLNKNHSLEDLQELVKELERETGFTGVQISIHRDEGHIKTDKKGKEFAIKNYHAHIIFFTLDKKTGQQLYRRRITEKQKETQPTLKPMNRERLSHIQTIVAKSLNMERGEEGSNATRLSSKEYRAVQKQIEKEKKILIQKAKNYYLPKIKDIKEINNQLRLELQKQKSKREDYSLLEQTIKNLKDEVRAKTLTLEKMNIEIANLREQILKTEEIKKENQKLKDDNLWLEDKLNKAMYILNKEFGLELKYLEEAYYQANNKKYSNGMKL